MSFKTVAVLYVCMCISFISCSPSMDKAGVDSVVNSYKKENDPFKKEKIIRKLLEKNIAPENREEDIVSTYMINQLSTLFRNSNDPIILNVINTTTIDTSFINTYCDFYSDIFSNQYLAQMYRQDLATNSGVSRCIGTVFGAEEIEKISKDQNLGTK